MNQNNAELLGATASAALTVLVLVGLAVRYVLLPWLREHLITPLLQRLDAIAQRVEGVTSDLKVASGMYEGHITRSAEEWGRLWDAIHELRDQLTTTRRRRRRAHHQPTHREDNHP
jgi:hypothetical protein